MGGTVPLKNAGHSVGWDSSFKACSHSGVTVPLKNAGHSGVTVPLKDAGHSGGTVPLKDAGHSDGTVPLKYAGHFWWNSYFKRIQAILVEQFL